MQDTNFNLESFKKLKVSNNHQSNDFDKKLEQLINVPIKKPKKIIWSITINETLNKKVTEFMKKNKWTRAQAIEVILENFFENSKY